MPECDISVEIEDAPVYEITLPTDNPIYVDTGTGAGGGVLGSITWGQVTDKPVIVLNEAPTGNINGTNKTFVTNSFFLDGAIWVFLNGLKLNFNDYSVIDQHTIQLVDAPFAGDVLIVDYIKQN